METERLALGATGPVRDALDDLAKQWSALARRMERDSRSAPAEEGQG